jgi:hypothetical protein
MKDFLPTFDILSTQRKDKNSVWDIFSDRNKWLLSIKYSNHHMCSYLLSLHSYYFCNSYLLVSKNYLGLSSGKCKGNTKNEIIIIKT